MPLKLKLVIVLYCLVGVSNGQKLFKLDFGPKKLPQTIITIIKDTVKGEVTSITKVDKQLKDLIYTEIDELHRYGPNYDTITFLWIKEGYVFVSYEHFADFGAGERLYIFKYDDYPIKRWGYYAEVATPKALEDSADKKFVYPTTIPNYLNESKKLGIGIDTEMHGWFSIIISKEAKEDTFKKPDYGYTGLITEIKYEFNTLRACRINSVHIDDSTYIVLFNRNIHGFYYDITYNATCFRKVYNAKNHKTTLWFYVMNEAEMKLPQTEKDKLCETKLPNTR